MMFGCIFSIGNQIELDRLVIFSGVTMYNTSKLFSCQDGTHRILSKIARFNLDLKGSKRNICLHDLA